MNIHPTFTENVIEEDEKYKLRRKKIHNQALMGNVEEEYEKYNLRLKKNNNKFTFKLP